MSLDSMKEIFDRMEAEHKPFWEIVLETDMDERQVTRQQSMAKMLTTWQYMVDAADTYTGRRRSVSGLAGGDGLKMRPIRPASPAPPAAARRRSALPPLWRRGPWWPCGTAPANRSATPWPWP